MKTVLPQAVRCIRVLVEKAIKANPDLDAAKAALRGAWENVYAQKGALLPSVSAGYGVSRQKVGDPLASPLTNNANLFTLHTAQVGVAYTLDVFGARADRSRDSRPRLTGSASNWRPRT